MLKLEKNGPREQTVGVLAVKRGGHRGLSLKGRHIDTCMMRTTVVLMLLHAASCAALECSGGEHEFENSPRPAGWTNADQRFGVKKESDGHHHIKCESARTPTAGTESVTYTRATMEFKLAEIGIGGQWGEVLFQLMETVQETRFRVKEVNGVSLSTEQDGNAKATTVVPTSYEKYKVCSSGDDDSFMEFGDALVLESTYANADLSGLKVSAFGFRSEDAKKRVLEGNQLFAVDANMGSCRMEIVIEIPVPTSGDLSFEVEFYVHNATNEDQINAALKTQEVGNEILVTYDDTELMGMSTGLVCKSTTLAVPASNVTRERVDDGSKGEVWKYSVPRSAVAACGAVVFDPRMTPAGAPTLAMQQGAQDAGCRSIASSLTWAFTIAANVLALRFAFAW